MNERSDWMIYGCLSALGFSLNENYGYLVAHGLLVGTPRFFLATPLHLSLTGFLALTLRRIYQRESHAWRRFAAALMGVALIHGTYDFLASSASPIAALAGAVLGPLWGLVFVRIFETVASSSPFRRNPAAYRMSCTSWFMGAFALLCILNYATIARVLGAEEASSKLAEDLVAGQVLLLIGLVYSRLEFVKVDAALLAHRRRSQPGTGAVGRTATGGPHRS